MGLVNGYEFSFNDATVEMLGRVLEGCSGFANTSAKVKENMIGRGGKIVSRVRGSESYEASLTVYAKEVFGIEDALPPNKDLTDIKPFPVTITYINEEGLLRSYLWEDAEFTQLALNPTADSPGITIELPLIISGIKRI